MPHCLKSRVAAHILMCPYLAGVHARNQEFYSGGGGGGGGVQVRRPENNLDNVFFLFFLFFYSPELILQLTEGVQWFYYRENYTFQRIQRGSRIFQGEGV